MAVIFHCECGKEFLTSVDDVGRRVTCSVCRRELTVPQPKPLADGDYSKQRLSGRGISISRIALLSLAMLLAAALVPALLTAIVRPGPAPRRAQCMNNLKMIALAIHQYESAHGCFPPAATFDNEGKPLLSWRVLILPYMHDESIYKQFHLDEAWDSPHNKPLADRAPGMYLCPSEELSEGLTIYKVVVDPHSIFTGRPAGVALVAVTDGIANTLLVVEGSAPVSWSKPDDLSLTSSDPLLGMGSNHPGGFNAATVDGSVQFIQKSINPRVLKGLVTRDGNEAVTIPR
jgi:prepilin-type processing-associated H-X9-DG protein